MSTVELLRLLRSVASCYIKRKNKWANEDIDSFQFGSLMTAKKITLVL